MLALSTAWYPRSDPRIVPTLRAILAMGFRTVEIGCSKARFRRKKTLAALERLGMEVCSVHNVCSERKPAPGNERGDWLASPHPEQRRAGVEATVESIANAKALGARAVVLHLGSLPVERSWEKQELLYRLARHPGAAAQLGVSADEVLAERRALAPDYLEAACRSLEELLERTDGVSLGIETRMGWHELPSLDELGTLLERFPQRRVGYWHDVGHAVLQGAMGLGGQLEWLRRHGPRTLGVHLHDVTAGLRDHHPPGLGEVDFAPLAERLPPGALRVMEVASRFIAEELAMGKRRLEEAGLCD
ncbi:MAG: sugar phosphate isomerase/epimerase family protein [Candidatus Brocadiia bacterium]